MTEFWFLQAFFEIFADPESDQLNFKKMVRIESEFFLQTLSIFPHIKLT